MSQNRTQNINAVLTILQVSLDGSPWCGDACGPFVSQLILNDATKEFQALEEEENAN